MRDEDQRNAKGTKHYTTKEVYVEKGLNMKEQKAGGIQRFIPSSSVRQLSLPHIFSWLGRLHLVT